MYKKQFQHLSGLRRVRIAESDEVSMRLQRLEKPEAWPMELQNLIYTTIPENLLNRYPDPGPFYTRLAHFLGVSEDRLLITSGIDEAIKSLLTLCCEPGDKIAFTPGYAMYGVYSRIFGLNQVSIAYDPERFMSAEELCENVPEDAKILFLPNPGQPVENCFNLDQLGLIARYCRQNGILFAIDEAYHFFGAPSALPLIEEFNNLVVMRTFSKAFGGASLRLGYMAGSDIAMAPLLAFRLAHETNAFSLHAGCVLLDHFDNFVRTSIDKICEGRDFIRQAAEKHGLRAWGSCANFVLIDLGSNERMKQTVNVLKEKGILVKSGYPAPLERHILVTCGSVSLMKRFYQDFCRALDMKLISGYEEP